MVQVYVVLVCNTHLIDVHNRYCIPMEDDSRPITVAEETFFSKCGTGKGEEIVNPYYLLSLLSVPVIVVFSKFDALHAVAFGELREQGMSMKKAAALAPEHAKEIFKRNDYYSRVQAMKFPPRNFICMGGEQYMLYANI